MAYGLVPGIRLRELRPVYKMNGKSSCPSVDLMLGINISITDN